MRCCVGITLLHTGSHQNEKMFRDYTSLHREPLVRKAVWRIHLSRKGRHRHEKPRGDCTFLCRDIRQLRQLRRDHTSHRRTNHAREYSYITAYPSLSRPQACTVTLLVERNCSSPYCSTVGRTIYLIFQDVRS